MNQRSSSEAGDGGRREMEAESKQVGWPAKDRAATGARAQERQVCMYVAEERNVPMATEVSNGLVGESGYEKVNDVAPRIQVSCARW